MNRTLLSGICLIIIVNLILTIIVLVRVNDTHDDDDDESMPADVDTLLFWSEMALNSSAQDHAQATPTHGGPLRTARVQAIVHVAMADAVALTTGAFSPMLVPPASSVKYARTQTREAVSVAAHTALTALYPAFQQQFDAALVRYSSLQSPAWSLGHACAERALALRADDGSAHAEPAADAFESTVPGRWRRDPVAQHTIALGGRWAELVRPWTLTTASDFRAPPPPAVTSMTYAMEYLEALSLGGDNSTACVRDAWREFVGRFWAYDASANICAPTRLYYQIAHALVRDARPSAPTVARLLGTLGVAFFDAGLAAWDSKYYYLRERPVTAVRTSAAADGNAMTQTLAHWTPLGAPATNNPSAPDFTPPFPAYPSGHATFGAALAEVLRAFELDRAFHFVSDEYNGHAVDARTGLVRPRVERFFSSLAEAEEENGQSRMYLGIHWASDKTAGIEMGHAVARHIVRNVYVA